MHRFLALPVVDRDHRIVGVVDVDQFTDEVFDLAAREQADTVFEALGIRLDQMRTASPWRAFRLRFPWLLATIAGGTVCALLLSAFEATLAESLVLAFFLALVLGLGESVAVQSMTVTIQVLRARSSPRVAYPHALRREVLTAALLGTFSGAVVGLIVYLWKADARSAAAIGLGICGALLAACAIGLSIPWVFHARKLDLKIAVGPLVLACTDVCTVTIYLVAAGLLAR
jgi:magnesium transporter